MVLDRLGGLIRTPIKTLKRTSKYRPLQFPDTFTIDNTWKFSYINHNDIPFKHNKNHILIKNVKIPIWPNEVDVTMTSIAMSIKDSDRTLPFRSISKGEMNRFNPINLILIGYNSLIDASTDRFRDKHLVTVIQNRRRLKNMCLRFLGKGKDFNKYVTVYFDFFSNCIQCLP